MYLWNVKALASDLRDDKVTERNKLSYYLLYVLFGSVVSEIAKFGPLNINVYSLAIAISNILIIVLGICFCFVTNSKGDNRDFINRFICLSIPISCRIASFMVLGILALYKIGGLIGGQAFDSFMYDSKEIQKLIFMPIIGILYFYLISLNLKWIGKENS